jgi:hypothetical protein
MTALKIILSFIAGIVVGSLVNMGLVNLGMMLVPPPPGVDFGDMESLKTTAHLLEFKHYVFPFLAHALGTLVGAWVAYRFAPASKTSIAWIVGVFFLAGGVAASMMIPGSKIFIVVDLAFAYLPMAWLAIRLGERSGAGAMR